jgi:hypothetical protein
VGLVLSNLEAASTKPIQESTRRLVDYGAYKRWLSSSNRYRKNAVDVLESDYKASTINARHLSDYIAASAPLHCCDGWGLLGRALSCHLRGDSSVARHLAYYAELRAAMSLLATQGIGVFRLKHFALDAEGTPHRVHNQGTHVAAWELLDAWAGLSSAAATLGEILAPAGQPIADWIDTMSLGAPWHPIAAEWLRSIGLDLQIFSSDDRDARNEASYRPAYIRQTSWLPSRDALQTAVEIWRLLEPSPSLAFPELDRYLLRKSLEAAFESVRGKTRKQARARFRSCISQTVTRQVDQGEERLWNDFLMRVNQPDDPVVLRLSEERGRARPDYHVSMMARALLLLRVASGATRLTMKQAGARMETLSFWWQPYGEQLGLWDAPAPDVARLTDGWADVELMLETVGAYVSEGDDTYWGTVTQLPDALASFTSMEMVGVWSLAA